MTLPLANTRKTTLIVAVTVILVLVALFIPIVPVTNTTITTRPIERQTSWSSGKIRVPASGWYSGSYSPGWYSSERIPLVTGAKVEVTISTDGEIIGGVAPLDAPSNSTCDFSNVGSYNPRGEQFRCVFTVPRTGDYIVVFGNMCHMGPIGTECGTGGRGPSVTVVSATLTAEWTEMKTEQEQAVVYVSIIDLILRRIRGD